MTRLRIMNASDDDRDELTLFARPRCPRTAPIAWRVVPLARGIWTEIETGALELDVSWNGDRTGVRAPLRSLRETFTVEAKERALHIRNTGVNPMPAITVSSDVRIPGGIACGIRAGGQLLLQESPIAFRQRITTFVHRSLAAALTRGASEGRALDPSQIVQELPSIVLRDAALTLRGSLESGYVLR